MNRRRRMLSSSSVGKKGSHCSTKLCTPVWFSIDSKGHLQARKKGKAEKLRENCGKIAINCGKLRKIAKNCEKLRNCGKLQTSISPPPLPSCDRTVRTAPTNVYGRVSSAWVFGYRKPWVYVSPRRSCVGKTPWGYKCSMGGETHQGRSWGSECTMGLEIHHGVRNASRRGHKRWGVCDTILVGRRNLGGP